MTKCFVHNWPFVRGIHQSPLHFLKSVFESFDVFFVIHLNKLLNKQLSCQWFQMAELSCDGTLMTSQLALRRWPNVNPYVGPTSGHQRWANVDLSIGPTVARQRWPNVVPTSAQRWHTNVGPTLAQRYANGCMPTLYQHWPNGGCVTGFLWAEPIGHRSVTGWTNSRVE